MIRETGDGDRLSSRLEALDVLGRAADWDCGCEGEIRVLEVDEKAASSFIPSECDQDWCLACDREIGEVSGVSPFEEVWRKLDGVGVCGVGDLRMTPLLLPLSRSLSLVSFGFLRNEMNRFQSLAGSFAC